MKSIYIDITPLPQEKKFTYLSSDATSAGTSLAVQSIVGLTTTAQILLLGEIKQEKAEVVYPSRATVPSGTTIYLFNTTAFDHSQDTKVTVLDWDEVQFWHAATVAGVKSVLSTMAIQPDMDYNYYNDTAQTTGYYFTRYRNTLTSGVSDYSDAIPYGDYADNTVFKIKQRALESCNEKISDLITHEWLNQQLWQARREYHNSQGKRPFRRMFNADLGNVATGAYRVNLPSDIESPHTAENLFGVRISTNGNLDYYDKKYWDFDYQGKPHTTTDVAYVIGQQDLWCSDVRDFSDSGTVQLEDDTITYSAKGVSGGTLRISADGGHNHAVATDVWQNVSMGLPSRYAVFMDAKGSASINFNCPFSTSYVNQNIWGDYYRTLVDYDSDADVLDEPEYDMYVYWLAWCIKKKKAQGLQPLQDPDFLMWQQKKAESLAKEYLGTEIRIYPEMYDNE